MKIFSIAFIVLLLQTVSSSAQLVRQSEIDSAEQLIANARADSTKIRLSIDLGWRMSLIRPDITLSLAQRALQLALKNNDLNSQVNCENLVGLVWWIIGDFQQSIDLLIKTERKAMDLGDKTRIADIQDALVRNYRDQGNYTEALNYCRKGMKDIFPMIWRLEIGSVYQNMHQPDSALYYLLSLKDMNDGFMGYGHLQIGLAYFQKGNYELAMSNYKKCIELLSTWGNTKDIAGAYNAAAILLQKQGLVDSSVSYLKKSLAITQDALFKKEYYESCMILSAIQEKVNPGQSIYYLKQAMAAKDSLFNIQKVLTSANNRFNEEMQNKEVQREKTAYQNKIKFGALLAGVSVFLLLSIILYRNNRQKQRAKADIEKAYADLKQTQSQLIQSEKMASLGQLTAGIAHEIQNPLNFVNNFSEINNELIEEANREMENGKSETTKELLNDIYANNEKIVLHGKRADAIVKGMLEHSRQGTGEKQLTDINALADEYLKLAYNGLRAKDKNFNALLKTDFDTAIGKINIVAQDIGRVLLNLYNNAFYAVREKAGGNQLSANGYELQVIVTTKKSGDQVFIVVEDNGGGIPDAIKDKIFQPFFTTKATGQGTGLGLSLAYDIVKAHGGEIKVESKEGEGSNFIVRLPVT